MDRFNTLVIPADRVPVAAYQAIYHRLTKNTENLKKRRQGTHLVSPENLSDLHNRLEQRIQQYQVKSKREEIAISFSDQTSEDYSSFERFSAARFDHKNTKTRTVSYVFDFLVVLPLEIDNAPEVAQRYRLELLVGAADLSEDELEEHYYVEGSYLHQINHRALHYSIDYVDRSVANTLSSVVMEWAEGVETNNPTSKKNAILKQSAKVFGYSAPFMVGSVLLGGAYFEPSQLGDSFTPIRYLILIVLLAIIAGLVGELISSKMRKAAVAIYGNNMFLFTKGDADFAELEKTRKNQAKWMLAAIFTGLILSSIAGIFVNAISAWVVTT